MPEILALLQNITPVVSRIVLRQLNQAVYGMSISDGRIIVLETSRFCSGCKFKGSFSSRLRKSEYEYIAADDEVVFGKAGEENYNHERHEPHEKTFNFLFVRVVFFMVTK